MNPKKLDFGSGDIISNLPENLICHILSFIPIEESALTSVLSKKWRYLFAFSPNLEFDDSVYHHRYYSAFLDFVEHVLFSGDYSTLNKFSLKCGRSQISYESRWIIDWISNVLERGVSDLDLRVNLEQGVLSSKLFVTKSLVSLRIESKKVLRIDVEDVFLPKLKTLYLDKVMLGKADDCFEKLTSGCHVLEELTLIRVYSDIWNRSFSSKTLKRLTLWCINYDKNPDSVSFDTPNVVYLEYSDYVACKYPKVDFGSLVEAFIDLQMTSDQFAHATYDNLVGNATDFLMGICNVEVLQLSSNTLEVLTFCCEAIPVFNNLIHLTIQTNEYVGWECLPGLLRNCPSLETLVFKGLHHRDTTKCVDVDGCLCKSSEDIPTCLSSSPVKVLKILKLSGDIGVEKQLEQIKHFLETMPRLELVAIYYDTLSDDYLIKVSDQLKKHPRIASSNCKIEVIADNLS